MPYINDRLAAQHEIAEAKTYKEHPVRQSRFYFEPAEVMALLKSQIVGQDAALTAVDDMLHVVKADITAGQRPLSVMLLMGPTGVGKTETVRLIAEAIHGSADALCRIDMNTLAQEHYAAALTGAPPGYVGSKEGQTLFDPDKIKGSFARPGVVLFDELEKANNDVIRALMNVLDTGRLVLSNGLKSLDFTNTLIFMSSNIGAKEIERRRSAGFSVFFSGNEKKVAAKALESHFDPEFLNRIDRIVDYQRLSPGQCRLVLDVELTKLHRRLAKRSVQLEIDYCCHDFLLESIDRRYGAREIARRIRQILEPEIARAMLAHADVQRFVAVFQNSKISVAPDSLRESVPQS